ncbi:hypothetical protein LIER_42640 [Lithospermum erythrorhizon]|uniref:Uncharacterized protein n=1 Tax=Lithospermum erythrorhizon TaxID=34254 RepID=A0AAV3NPW6_LITER
MNECMIRSLDGQSRVEEGGENLEYHVQGKEKNSLVGFNNFSGILSVPKVVEGQQAACRMAFLALYSQIIGFASCVVTLYICRLGKEPILRYTRPGISNRTNLLL